MAQLGNAAPRALPSVTSPEGLPLDGARLEQLLALQLDLLDPGLPRDVVGARVVQGAVTLLGFPGAALGTVAGTAFRVLASTGDDTTLLDDAMDAEVSSAGRGGRLALPVRGRGVDALLRVALPPGGATDESIALCRVLAMLAGAALAGAAARDHAARTTRIGRDVLAAMAHDLRAPLNGLVGYSQLLAEETFGALTDEQRDIAHILVRQARELADLLTATLDVAGLEAQRLPIRTEAVNVDDAIETLRLATFAAPTREGRVHWRTAADIPSLRTDRVKLKAIVQNLVENALKHGAGAPVEVDVIAIADRDVLRITVRDRGPGIPAAVVPHLFEPFRSGAPGGVGLGLYVVRSFAEALGGRIAVHTAPDEGATLIVEVPMVAPDATD
jgi:signal transduction histidine kinase